MQAKNGKVNMSSDLHHDQHRNKSKWNGDKEQSLSPERLQCPPPVVLQMKTKIFRDNLRLLLDSTLWENTPSIHSKLPLAPCLCLLWGHFLT